MSFGQLGVGGTVDTVESSRPFLEFNVKLIHGDDV
jgi:hypothetical protein